MKIRSAELLLSCAKPRDFPGDGPPEVAFLGRSNVGKSSLLNRLANRKKLARTSGTPGKTRLIHFFRIEAADRELLFVDLPGYGWARVSRRERESWGQMVEGYLDAREPLRVAILLQDLRRDVSEDETLLIDWLAERDNPTCSALTKGDRLKPMGRKARIAELRKQLKPFSGPILATAALRGEGVDELWKAILAAL